MWDNDDDDDADSSFVLHRQHVYAVLGSFGPQRGSGGEWATQAVKSAVPRRSKPRSARYTAHIGLLPNVNTATENEHRVQRQTEMCRKIRNSIETYHSIDITTGTGGGNTTAG